MSRPRTRESRRSRNSRNPIIRAAAAATGETLREVTTGGWTFTPGLAQQIAAARQEIRVSRLPADSWDEDPTPSDRYRQWP